MHVINYSIYFILFLVSVITTSVSSFRIRDTYINQSSLDKNQENELLYLPNKDAIKYVTFGYNNFLADILWFTTINYFGKHYVKDKDYRWLYYICDLITSIDSKAKHVYQFGSTMLAWEQKSPEHAVDLLTKAISVFPEDWNFYYLRGFLTMYFLQDKKSAAEDFLTASKLPGVHPIVITLASRQLENDKDSQTAIAFLQQMLRDNTDPTMRSALENRLQVLRHKFIIERKSEWEEKFTINEPMIPSFLSIDGYQE